MLLPWYSAIILLNYAKKYDIIPLTAIIAEFKRSEIKEEIFMPFIDVKTNVKVSEEQKNSIKSAMGQAITAIPGKTESWLMVGIKPEYDLWFKGDKSAAAMVEVSIFGGASHNAFTTLTSHITGILTDQLGIPSDRIYVKYNEVENWGWNGSNF